MENTFDNSAEEKWLMDKWGMFGASDMHKLLAKGVGTNMFGVGAMTHIKKIARQAYTLFNTQDNAETYAMKMGKILEPQSFAHVYRLLGVTDIEYYGSASPIFIRHQKEFNKDAGCSPDALYKKEDKVIFGIELKNPNGDTHWDYLSEISNQKDLEKVCKDHYTQCQFSMACTNSDLWLWCSYNEFYPDKDKALIIEVRPDESFMENLNARVSAAIIKKYELIEERKNKN